MLLHANAILAALRHLQLLGWDMWSYPALLVGFTPFLLGHLLLNVCHPLLSKCHLFLACGALFPA